MAKYYRFHYSAGYCGTDEGQIAKFADDVSGKEVEEAFDNWYELVKTCEGSYEEISEEEAEDEGIDEDYTD